jgi:hypothetical protein
MEKSSSNRLGIHPLQHVEFVVVVRHCHQRLEFRSEVVVLVNRRLDLVIELAALSASFSTTFDQKHNLLLRVLVAGTTIFQRTGEYIHPIVIAILILFVKISLMHSFIS